MGETIFNGFIMTQWAGSGINGPRGCYVVIGLDMAAMTRECAAPFGYAINCILKVFVAP
jgi:hypothetical protein